MSGQNTTFRRFSVSDPATLLMGPEDRQRAEALSLRPLRPPTQVPGYEPERFLGRGAYGEVWVAKDCNSGRRVAIKFFSQRGRQDWSLLAREAEKLGYFFNDRHVVQLLKVGWDADPPYYVMEYLENGSLDDHLPGPLPLDRAVSLFREIASGLLNAHNRGVLHCDLKPANILLDADGRPRLADFGQARLADEHVPALGTLFYMAPEQADLKAVPDARWDVYSLGALLYRMTTGELPYRSPETATALEQTRGLEERLSKYRHLLREAPRPRAHYRIPGIDRALVQIINRCLAVQPEKRYPNVQAVLSALDSRAIHRARKPLLVLGALGPALLLGGMFLFAWWLIVSAVGQTKEQIIEHVQDGNRMMARFAAERLAERIQLRWAILEEEAALPAFQDILKQVENDPPMPGDESQPPRAAVQRLQQWLDQVRQRYQNLHVDDSWFVVGENGRLLDTSSTRGRGRQHPSMGRFVWNRDYFHGQGADHDPPPPNQPRPANMAPIRRPHQSVIFRSAEDHRPFLVVYSVPIRTPARGNQPPVTLGVLAMAVRLGTFSELWTTPDEAVDSRKRVTLVETREQTLPPDANGYRVRNAGLILEHPSLRNAETGEVPLVYVDGDSLSELRETGRTTTCRDPLDRNEKNRTLAAAEPVRVRTKAGGPLVDSGWLIVVQDDYASAIQPAVDLEWRLLTRTLVALAVAIALVTALWISVGMGLIDAPRSRLAAFVRRHSGLSSRTPGATAARSAAGSLTSGSSLGKSPGTDRAN